MKKRILSLLTVAAIVLAVTLPTLAADYSACGKAAMEYLKGLKGWNTISVDALNQKLSIGEDVFVLDVRTPEEYAAGHIEGAVNVEGHTILDNLDKLPKDKNALIAVHCKSGVRSTYVAFTLQLYGYQNALTVVGGFDAWVAKGYPVVK